MLASLESEKEQDKSSCISSLNEFLEPEPSSTPNQLQNALDEFREKWQSELKPSQLQINVCNNENEICERNLNSLNQSMLEEKALDFFTQAVDLERRGKVYDALVFYRKAVQIDPVIELKFHEKTLKYQENELNIKAYEIKGRKKINEDLRGIDLCARFANDLNKNHYFIKGNTDLGVILTNKHVSELPMEILYNILRWVVSAQLDIRSLESVATVCKGLYLCARDNELWKLICLKVWGVNTGTLVTSSFKTWREMYIERERVHFHGCYISKTTYLRYGENSFQDQFYRPVQLIEYYRYFRFLPDGNVIMWTTTEEPAQAVYKLKILNQLRPEILKGHYRLHGDIVTIMLKRNLKQNSSTISKCRGNFRSDLEGSYIHYIDLKILSKGKKRFFQLQWNNYSIVQMKNKRETCTNFEISSSKYPPFWFSRVKNYHLEAVTPLQ